MERASIEMKTPLCLFLKLCCEILFIDTLSCKSLVLLRYGRINIFFVRFSIYP